MDQGHSTSAKMVFSSPDLTSLNAAMETGPAYRLLAKRVRTKSFSFFALIFFPSKKKTPWQYI
jgi:hypothetical protein